ncbi:MAG: hypothetical protein MJB14_13980, partial [Spirochaetes bacterium]|nr:hypothetical protein [Spirochaetota bacterium]
MTDFIGKMIVRNFSFPFSNWLYNRRNIYSHYKKAKISDYLSPEKLEKIQLRELKNILSYAFHWIPYYQEKFHKIGLVVEDVKRITDLKNIPPLTRQDVIDNYLQMVDIRFVNSINAVEKSNRKPGEPILFARFKKNKLIKNTSSGSTGYPTTFFEDGSVTALNWANELRLKKWFGMNPGEKEARLVRASVGFMSSDKVVQMRKLLWNQLLLPGVNLQENDYKVIYQQLKMFQPKVIWGFSIPNNIANYEKVAHDT